MSKHLERYVQYIRNTGLVPLDPADFDDDFEPIGPTLRAELLEAGLITVDATGGIRLVPTPVTPAMSGLTPREEK